MEEKVIEIIKNLIIENDIEVSTEEINDSTSLTNDLGLDSFNLAQLTVEIESEFGVDIFENGVISSVGDIFKQLKWYFGLKGSRNILWSTHRRLKWW